MTLEPAETPGIGRELQRESWECPGLPAGSAVQPVDLETLSADWIPAQVPGTVAGAFRAAGRPTPGETLDQRDWWFRCRFAGDAGPRLLEVGGIATVADVWLNGHHLWHNENMFRGDRLAVDLRSGDNELVLRCAALSSVLNRPRPRQRPRWKTYLVEHQSLRWIRTSLLGRIPGWAVVPPAVGPWRPIRLLSPSDRVPLDVSLRSSCVGDDGLVEAQFVLHGAEVVSEARLRSGSVSAEMAVHRRPDGGLMLAGTLRFPTVDRWWPHTHGSQPLYEVWADVDGRSFQVGKVGFRTLTVDRRDGAFRVEINGETIFCRGATWMPIDPVTLVSSEADVQHRLALVRAAHMNMVRVPGTTIYEDRAFLERCDETGILVWHDCMFAFMDPPLDEAFQSEVVAEVSEAFAVMGGHPSLVVVCGNQEVEEVAAMNGLDADRFETPLFDETIAAVAESALPGVAYVSSNPTGGSLPFRMNVGLSQYFGIGGYLRPIENARRDGVRFAVECLAFATPPEPDTVEEVCGGAYRAGHDPSWKRGVHHDAGRSWDMEDVRDHYLSALFKTDPRMERYIDAERALELGRATNAHLMASVMSDWRRPGSTCDGALVLALGDLREGAGWGLVDVLGRPKAPWYALRRVFQPVALLLGDEGLNGLWVHVVNDSAESVRGRLVVELVVKGEKIVERGEVAVEAGPRGSASIDAETVLGGFRDITYSYRFSPPVHDAVVATLTSEDGDLLSQVVYFPLGQARPLEPDLGLTAVAQATAGGSWRLEVSTVRLAQWVTVRAPGFIADDSWFHLPPGATRSITLRSDRSDPPRGTVDALNTSSRAVIKVDGSPDGP